MNSNHLPPNLLDHYEDPYHRGMCDHPTHESEIVNAACGDTIVVQLRIVEDVVQEAWFDGEGCQCSQAVASLLMEKIEGKPTTEIREMTVQDIATLIGAEVSEAQSDCCMVAWKTTLAALDAPIDEFGDESTFSGPGLGEEC